MTNIDTTRQTHGRSAAGGAPRVSPFDLRPLHPVHSSSVEEIGAAVQRARSAQAEWQRCALDDRIVALESAAKEMLRRRDEVIVLARTEVGKVAAEGIFNEALGPLEAVVGWAAVVRRATGRRRVRLNPLSFPKKDAHVDFVPRGVVGVIAPWNFPVAGLYRSMIPALMSGNGVVLKPSEHSPLTSAWLAECLQTALPDGLVQVLQGDGRVGSALVDAGIDACVFTGSSHTGRLVRIQCAERAVVSSIEMGGKDPAIVLADCDLDRTVAGVTHWALSNVGQACGAIEILYVDQQIADEVVERLRAAWSKLTVGTADADVGPLANRRQLQVVTRQVDEARAKGAKVVCGGAPTGVGLAFAPTILYHCTETMSVVQEETFGPVLAVVRVEGAAEAVRAANASRYGLGASIWTTDLARGRRLASRLEYGIVTINNHAFTGAIPALPWSGTRETGFGVANGPESLATFVRPRTTVVDASSAPEPFWLPYDRALVELGDILADVQIRRFGRAWKIPLLLRKRVATVRAFFDRRS